MEIKKSRLRQLFTTLTTVSCCIAVFGCTTKVDLEAERDTILRIDKEWSSVTAEGRDLDRIVSYWADDAVVFPPGFSAVVGKEEIRQYVAESFKIPGFSIGWEAIEVTVSPAGDFAYITGKNHFTVNDSEGKPVTSYGKVVTVWRKGIDGDWKCVIDIWNGEPVSES